MAATVGATVSTLSVFPDRHTNLGPFPSSAGWFSFFGRDSTNTGQVRPSESNNPMSSFADGSLKTMSSGTSTAIQAMGCYQVGDVVHVATQISTGAVYYNNYNLLTSAWGFTTSELAVAAASVAPVTGTTFVDLVVRSTGSVVFAYNAGQTAMSSTFNMVRYRIRQTNGVYGTAANVDNGGSVNWLGPIALRGASDRVHFFFGGNGQFQRTLSAANALQAFPSAFNAGSIAAHMFGPGTSYNSDANVAAARAGAGAEVTTNGSPAVVYQTSADAPTTNKAVIADAGSSTNAMRTTNTEYVQSMSYYSGTLHALHARSGDQDLYHYVSTDDGATWDAGTNELAATLNAITANVYTRSGTNYLAMVLDDAGTLKYAEITLTAAVTASLIWPTETPYRILSRR